MIEVLERLDHTYLRKILHYNQNDGCLRWAKKRPRVNVGDRAGYAQKVKSTGKVYRMIGINGKYYSEHRLIWFYVNGTAPKGEIDHINGDGTDNRLCNLRDVTRDVNQKNKTKYKNNKSGICGVCRPKRINKWFVDIQHGGEKVYLGLYEDFFEACCARKSAENKYCFHANHGCSK